MARYREIYNSCQSGELSDKLRGRTDLEEFKNGLATMLNMTAGSTGGAFARMGTRFINNIFQTAESQSIFKTALSADSEVDIPMFPLPKRDGILMLRPVNNGTHASSIVAEVVQLDGEVLTIGGFTQVGEEDENSSLAKCPQVVVDNPLGWHSAYYQDALIMCHNSGAFPPLYFEFDSETSSSVLHPWTTTAPSAITAMYDTNAALRVPYQIRNVNSDIKMKNLSIINAAAVGTDILIKAVDAGGTALTSYFTTPTGYDDYWIGKFLIVEDDVTTNSAYGGMLVSGGSPADDSEHLFRVMFRIKNDTAANNTSRGWRESFWGGDYHGYPRSVVIYEGRLIFGGLQNGFSDLCFASISSNVFFMMSQRFGQDYNVGDQFDMPVYQDSDGVQSSDAFDFRPSSGKENNDVAWMSASNNLVIGASSGEFVARGANGVFSNSSLNISPQTTQGGSGVEAGQVGESTIFVSQDGKSLFQFMYSEQNGQNVLKDLSLLSDEIIYHNADESAGLSRIKFKKLIWQRSNRVLWGITTDNALIGITIDPSSKTLGWHKHTIGGSGKVMNACSQLAINGNHENLFLIIKRTISAVDYYSLEKIGPNLELTNMNYASTDTKESEDDDLLWLLDGAIFMYSASATGSWTIAKDVSSADQNPLHLKDQEVSIIADGVYIGEATLSTYGLTLPNSLTANRIIVGYKYTKRLKSLQANLGSQIGTSMQAIKRIDQLMAKMYKSKGGTYGSDINNLKALEGFDSSIPTTAETIDCQLDFPSSPDRDGQVIMEQQDPVPFNVLALITRGHTSDG